MTHVWTCERSNNNVINIIVIHARLVYGTLYTAEVFKNERKAGYSYIVSKFSSESRFDRWRNEWGTRYERKGDISIGWEPVCVRFCSNRKEKKRNAPRRNYNVVLVNRSVSLDLPRTTGHSPSSSSIAFFLSFLPPPYRFRFRFHYFLPLFLSPGFPTRLSPPLISRSSGIP